MALPTKAQVKAKIDALIADSGTSQDVRRLLQNLKSEAAFEDKLARQQTAWDKFNAGDLKTDVKKTERAIQLIRSISFA